jgi:aspartyl-tRNA(Asn)/glutamyl-tRNA(Gln) amidotransferase subunit A
MIWTIHEAAVAIQQRRLSPVDLLNECLKQVDRLEGKVRAWVFIARDEAREQAEQLAKELERAQYRGPLHGIPIGVKDIFDVFDWPTAAGSKLWANSIARRDSAAVERLRQAGAIIMGKTVTTAYASFDPPPTRNPWNLDRTPGGSSSGSAAAVACGMCLGALASQTGGSTTRPASYCGVCAIKPTFGRISVNGVVPLAPSMDHVGIMTNCVRDLAVMSGALNDSFPTFSTPAAMSELERPPALGQLGGLFNERAQPVMQNAMIAAISRLRAAGASVVPLDPPSAFSEVLPRHQVVMSVEAAEVHQERIRRHPEDYPPRVTSLIREGLGTSATEYVRTMQHKESLIQALVEQLELSETHAFLTPATTGPAPAAETTGDPAFNCPWSYTGLPVVSFPIGWTDDGMPLCAQLTGDQFGEQDLFRWAAWCEQVIGFERREVRL